MEQNDTYTEHVRHRSTQLVQLLILCNRSRDVLRIVMGRVSGRGPDIGPISGAVLWQGAVSSPSSSYLPRPSPHLWPSISIQYCYRHGAASTDSRYEDDEWLYCPPRLSPRLSIRMTRTHIPRLVSLPCRCTTLLPGTLSKMSINKMTFNRKVKIGSLLTAWHRYLVIDLYITIPNLREAEREPSTHSAVYRPEKLLPIWEDKEGSGLGLPTNDCYGRSFDSIKHYKLTATQQQTFSQKWAAAFGRAADFLIQCWIYVFLFSGRGRNNVRITHQWSSARPPLGGELGD